MERFAFDQQIARMAEKNLLYEVIKAFARIDLSPERVDSMQMGYVFEELIRIGAEQSNEEAGEHFTPREVIKLMVNLLLSPEKDLRRQPRGQDHLRPGLRHRRHALGGRNYILDLERPRPTPCCSARTGTTRPGPSANRTCSSRARMPTTSGSATPSPSDGFDRDAEGRKITFDYMLANPPFGVEWKQQQHVHRSRSTTRGYDGPLRRRPAAHQRRLAALPAAHDLQDAAAEDGGSRIGIVFNGSPLFTGDAGSGESKSASGSSRTTGWRPSSPCRTSSSTTPASPPTSGFSPTARAGAQGQGPAHRRQRASG